MGSGHIADAVQLHESKLFDNFEDVSVAGRSLCKALHIKPQSTCLSIGNSNSHARSEQRSIGKSMLSLKPHLWLHAPRDYLRTAAYRIRPPETGRASVGQCHSSAYHECRANF